MIKLYKVKQGAAPGLWKSKWVEGEGRRRSVFLRLPSMMADTIFLKSVSPGAARRDGNCLHRRKVYSYEGKSWQTVGGGQDWR